MCGEEVGGECDINPEKGRGRRVRGAEGVEAAELEQVGAPQPGEQGEEPAGEEGGRRGV
jgi:hypothetical protein